MSTLFESLEDPLSTPIHDALAVGVDVLGQSQTVAFTPYVRSVLPIDGFVFWVNANLLTPAQLSAVGLASAAAVVVDGSLHYESIGRQEVDEFIVVRKVNFTALEQVTAFAAIAPKVLYVGEWQTGLGAFKFAFSSRSAYYLAANVHHYVGDAIYPVFERQLIDSVDDFDDRQVVSNSLPLWLAMVSQFPFPSPLAMSLELFPAMLVPDNMTTPYGVVDIRDTRTMQAAPWRNRNDDHYQLCNDRVELTLYGLRNDAVLRLVDFIGDYSLQADTFGLVSPLNGPRDVRRNQVEMGVLSQKKVMELEVSYNQVSVRRTARQLISTVVTPTIYPADVALSAVEAVNNSGGTN